MWHSRGPLGRTDMRTLNRLLAAVISVGVLLRAYPWLLPHTFGGMMEYDDGVYYGAASALLHGVVPYRDFVLLHPPLAGLLWTPFAAVGALAGDRTGMGLARIAVVAMSGVNMLLVGRLVLGGSSADRSRRIGAVAAGATYALYANSVVAEHTILLEGPTNLLGLLACWLLFLNGSIQTNRRLALAGAGFALATSVKMFGAAYFVAALLYLAVQRRGRGLPFLVGGYALTLLLVWTPFLIAAPVEMLRGVVLAQLTRPPSGGQNALDRMSDLLGLSAAIGHPAPPAMIMAAAVGLAALLTHLWKREVESRYWTILMLMTGIAFLLSSSFFSHYGDALAPPLAVTAGYAARQVAQSAAYRRGTSVAALLSATCIFLVLLVGAIRPLSSLSGQGDLALAAQRIVPPSACIYTDSVSLAIAGDRFRPPTASCPSWLDGRGEALVMSRTAPRDFYPRGFTTLAVWQTETLRQLCYADFVLVRGDPRTLAEWSPAAHNYVGAHFRPRQAWAGRWPWQLWQRMTQNGTNCA